MKTKLIKTVMLALFLASMLLAPVPAHPNKPIRYEVWGTKTDYGWIGTINSGPDLVGYTVIWVTVDMDFRGGEPLIDRSKNVHFFELWFIGDGIGYVAGKVAGTVVLAGVDEGVTRFKNGEFCGNGEVISARDRSYLIGRKEHCSGTVDFSIGMFIGTMQIN